VGQVSCPLYRQFAIRACLPDGASLRQIVNAVHAIPYGRPVSRTTQGVLSEWKGTCSTKHALLAELLREQWPGTKPRFVHRVYHVTHAAVLERYGDDAASAVPEGGLTDVHRYLVIVLAGQDVTIDITFPGAPAWDGHRSMSLACGDGCDYHAGEDPVQEWAIEAHWHAGKSASWPECPDHPRSHPLTPVLREDSPVWTCPRTGRLICGVGQLPSSAT